METIGNSYSSSVPSSDGINGAGNNDPSYFRLLDVYFVRTFLFFYFVYILYLHCCSVCTSIVRLLENCNTTSVYSVEIGHWKLETRNMIKLLHWFVCHTSKGGLMSATLIKRGNWCVQQQLKGTFTSCWGLIRYTSYP